MKVLIVAKTRRGGGACVGGITECGKSVRLIAHDAAHNQHAGLEYEVGEVWEVESAPDPHITPPHIENIIVVGAKRLRDSNRITETIMRFMPPVSGGPDQLFGGCARATASGGLYIGKDGGLPSRSTMFWISDKPLLLDFEGKRIRYRYPTADGGRTVTFVGFQEPVPEIPAGTLLRVSLAHWWRPDDKPDEELRCFVQLSGWFLADSNKASVRTMPEMERSITAAAGKTAGQDLHRQALEALKNTFGFAEFLPMQWEVIDRVLQMKDTLIVMPTGGGKSLCYQLPALVQPGLTVVVSPLVALMRDQVRQLAQVGVRAACLNHLVPLQEYHSIMRQVRAGHIRLLYLAPETLLRPETLLLLEQSRLARIAIDEVHCISEWGHDFRPEYRQLAPLRNRFLQAVWIALTATATARVREDIRRLLGIPLDGEFVASFNRQNLFIAVLRRSNCLAQVLAFLQPRRGQSGIIYCGKRKQADELCANLNANGWPAATYHAGMDGVRRNQNHEKFLNDEVPLVVATVAFGMGINKSNVRFVIHAHMPKDLESYYQEIGRAGRDGLPASCLLLYSPGDAVLHRRFIDQGAASERMGRRARLEAILQFAETRDCRRKPLLAYFGETIETQCGNCDRCNAPAPATKTVDRTREAVLLLSCARLTNQIFGQEHLIQILRGSRAGRIIQKSHGKLPMYGAGKEHSGRQWQILVGNLLDANLLERDQQFGSLRLTAKGYEVLNGNEKFFAPEEHDSIAESSEAAGPADAELLQKLKALRKRLADEAQMPAFYIFSDRSLVDMAQRLPQTPEQFLAVHGVGELKLANYGPPFLDAIRRHCAGSDAPEPSGPEIKRLPGSRTEQIAKLFDAGQSLDQIAASCQMQAETIVNHLRRFQQSGANLKPERVLRESKLDRCEQARVLELFEQMGHERLGPVFQALGATVSYKDLQLLRLYWCCKTRNPG